VSEDPNRGDSSNLPQASDQVGEEADNTPVQSERGVLQIESKSFYSGPLPEPQAMARYEDTLPGSANRILSLVENEQSIRQRDNRHILFNDTLRVLGSTVVSLSLVGAGLVCGFIDQTTLGVALGTSGAVVGVVRAFMGQREENPDE
jgi:uncharacterized membrane protein